MIIFLQKLIKKILEKLFPTKVIENKILLKPKEFGYLAVAGMGTSDIEVKNQPLEINVFFVKNFGDIEKINEAGNFVNFKKENLNSDEMFIKLEWEVSSPSILYWEVEY